MLYLVYEGGYYGEYCKMDLSDSEIKFIDNVLDNILYIFDPEELKPLNTPEQKTDTLYLIVSEYDIINLAYLNNQSKFLLDKLDYIIINYDSIKTINFYDWCKCNPETIKYFLDHDDYENSEHKKIIEKIFGKTIDK